MMSGLIQTSILPYIFISAAIVFAIRLFPFLVFKDEDSIPPVVRYIGKYLPPAIITGIVVYCLWSTDLSLFPYGLKELLAVLAVIGLHLWKRNTLISVFVSTAFYMILVQKF